MSEVEPEFKRGRVYDFHQKLMLFTTPFGSSISKLLCAHRGPFLVLDVVDKDKMNNNFIIAPEVYSKVISLHVLSGRTCGWVDVSILFALDRYIVDPNLMLIA